MSYVCVIDYTNCWSFQQELFIDSLVKEAYKYTIQAKKKTVQKRDIETAIDKVDALVFLEGTMD